ncbi:hypothetical protein SNL152K_5848 [Streptomyces sp. NL15-2K]|nr:hypothetical protein SNL152K_5848 [Streptomyces sp. NL15-2K]
MHRPYDRAGHQVRARREDLVQRERVVGVEWARPCRQCEHRVPVVEQVHRADGAGDAVVGRAGQLLGLCLRQVRVGGDHGERGVERGRAAPRRGLGKASARGIMDALLRVLHAPLEQLPVQDARFRIPHRPRSIGHHQRGHRDPRVEDGTRAADPALQLPDHRARARAHAPFPHRLAGLARRGRLDRRPPHRRVRSRPEVAAPPQIEDTGGRHHRHDMRRIHPHGHSAPPLLQPGHHPGRRVEPVRAAAGQHDRLDLLHQVARVEGVGLLGTGTSASYVHGGDGATLRGQHDCRTGEPTVPGSRRMSHPHTGNVRQSVNCHEPSLVQPPRTYPGRMSTAPDPAPEPRDPKAALVFDDPLDQQSSDDTDRGWGERPGAGADSAADLKRFLDEKPPHHL